MLPIVPKVVVCLVQVQLGIGESQTVHFLQPRKFVLVLCGGIVQLLARFLVIVKAVGKHLVIDESGTAEGLGKHNLLFGCRIEPVSVCLIHYSHLPWFSMYLRIVSMGAPPVVSRQ